MNAPRITVLMPIFNAGSYLEIAVRSILSQTFTDFEFLIIDDRSTDGSLVSTKYFLCEIFTYGSGKRSAYSAGY